jgi:hypothetical protein
MPRQNNPTGSLRDAERERRFILDAARGHAFIEQTTSLLEAEQELFGDSWAQLGARRHLRELLEECADIGARAAIAERALRHEQGLTSADRARTRAVLAFSARHAAQNHQVLTAVLGALKPEASA